MTQKRSLNGRFIANEDEYIQYLRDELLKARNKIKYYEGRCARLERRLQSEYRERRIIER